MSPLNGRPMVRKTHERPARPDCLCESPRNSIIRRRAQWSLVAESRIMENAIRNAIIKFEQEFMGRGPDDVRAFIVRDLVVVRLKGVLTPAERQLAKTPEGVDMVKRLRQTLITCGT